MAPPVGMLQEKEAEIMGHVSWGSERKRENLSLPRRQVLASPGFGLESVQGQVKGSVIWSWELGIDS